MLVMIAGLAMAAMLRAQGVDKFATVYWHEQGFLAMENDGRSCNINFLFVPRQGE